MNAECASVALRLLQGHVRCRGHLRLRGHHPAVLLGYGDCLISQSMSVIALGYCLWTDIRMGFAEALCIYGYSLFIFIFVAVRNKRSPMFLMRVLIHGLGTVHSPDCVVAVGDCGRGCAHLNGLPRGEPVAAPQGQDVRYLFSPDGADGWQGIRHCGACHSHGTAPRPRPHLPSLLFPVHAPSTNARCA